MAALSSPSCIFCKIIAGEIPSFKLIETPLSYSFLDINPIAEGHALVISKYHAEKLHELPDEYLQDLLPVAKKLALALGCKDYNVLQNNGKNAYQTVDHVHCHIIPKPSASNTEGLVLGWPTQSPAKEDLTKIYIDIKSRL